MNVRLGFHSKLEWADMQGGKDEGKNGFFLGFLSYSSWEGVWKNGSTWVSEGDEDLSGKVENVGPNTAET